MDDPAGLYAIALETTSQLIEALQDLPDPGGVIGKLIERIDGEREWVRSQMALGVPPTRPPGWLRRHRDLPYSAAHRDKSPVTDAARPAPVNAPVSTERAPRLNDGPAFYAS